MSVSRMLVTHLDWCFSETVWSQADVAREMSLGSFFHLAVSWIIMPLYIIKLRDVAADTSVSNRELDKHLKQIKDHSSALGH